MTETYIKNKIYLWKVKLTTIRPIYSLWCEVANFVLNKGLIVSDKNRMALGKKGNYCLPHKK